MTEIGYFIILLGAAVLLLYLQAYNQPKPLEPHKYKGVVSYVIDGDTVILKDKTKLRLWGVDASETGEEGAAKATNLLKTLVDQKLVHYIKIDTDRYGRTVARIFLKDGRDVNRLLIESGHTKEYCKYSKNYFGHCV